MLTTTIDFIKNENLDYFLTADHGWLFAPPYNAVRIDNTKLRVSIELKQLLAVPNNRMNLFSRIRLIDGVRHFDLFEPEPIVTHHSRGKPIDLGENQKKIKIEVQERIKKQLYERIEQMQREIERIDQYIADLTRDSLN